MEPDEIFALIVKADEKLKYATAAQGRRAGEAGGRSARSGPA